MISTPDTCTRTHPNSPHTLCSQPSARPQSLCEGLPPHSGMFKAWCSKRLAPSKSKEKGQKNSYHRDNETMLQESVVLLAVVMVGTSMKILEKVASNLALMIHRTLPGKSWGGGEANGGMRGRKKNMDKCKEEEKHGRGWGNISFPYLLGWGLGGVLRGWGGASLGAKARKAS